MVQTTNDHTSAEFVKNFKLEYLFERKQEVKFEVYQVMHGSQLQLLASFETTLARIMNSKEQTLSYDLKNVEMPFQNLGSLIVKGDMLN